MEFQLIIIHIGVNIAVKSIKGKDKWTTPKYKDPQSVDKGTLANHPVIILE